MVKRTNPDQFQLRLPEGLRNRIKAHADRHGRSMNAEIVRVLEREFPEPSNLPQRIERLLSLTEVMRQAISGDAVDRFEAELEATIVDASSGRIEGIDENMQREIQRGFELWQREHESSRRASSRDE